MMQCRAAKLWPPSHHPCNSTQAAHGLGPAAPLASWESPPACTGQAITHSSKGFPSVQKFRDSFELGAPSAGGLSLATNGTPILVVFTVAWQTALPASAVSSSVAVYNEAGDAWIIQAEIDGKINLLDAKTGAALSTVTVEGEITASPAMYGNLMVIGTTGRGTGAVYCFRID